MSRKLVWRRRTAEGFYRPAGQLPSVAALGFCRRARFLVRLSPPQPWEKWRGRRRDGVGVFEIGNFGIDVCHEGSRRAEAKALPPSKTPHAFEEMPTNNFVESSFWNFDALFQPQQHPAHDSHAPASRRYLPEDYVERVKLVLESGGYGSKGYGYDWKGKKLIRISFGHTTAVSTRILYMLAQQVFSAPRTNRWEMEPHS
ncbi:hypothetical protein C4D60_Mb09t13890 [Musa balbisiana]|uniref:Phenylalanyl-tRNA synthetase domain-containing protein n=1 Tax=Musa balbisiana TaxID=52838 RepID=A0A4S8IGB3_MUSBA|nr:hypothetical protein C4D60_Mb09t13890 [Musa balbisiana]